MGIMEGRDKQHLQNKYRELYFPLLITNWQVWPLAQVRFVQSFPTQSSLITLDTARQLSFHAPSLSRTLPIDMRCILDTLSLHSQLKVRFPLQPLHPHSSPYTVLAERTRTCTYQRLL